MGMPCRARILDFWREWLEENEVNLLEPQCWCCFRPFRKHPSFKKLAKMDNPSWREIRSAWNNLKVLDRCHIVSPKLGGTDDPDNIFLMCKRCHDRAPDTTSKEMFMRWVSNQYEVNELGERLRELRQALHDFGLHSDKEQIEVLGIFESHKFKVWARRNMVNHFGLYGPTPKMSTFVAALLEFRNQHKHQNTTQSGPEQLRLPFNDQ